MDFGLSEEQRDIQKLARQILSDLSTPQRLAAWDNWAGERFDRELWAKLCEAGLPGVAAPRRGPVSHPLRKASSCQPHNTTAQVKPA